jgi:processive 1,2-diacylglycerol beta-glucosyltransferase
MAAALVPLHKLKNLGFPVTSRFSTPEGVRPAPSVEAGRKVLFMINFGKRAAPALLARLLKIPGIDVTVTVGRDAALHARVEAVAAQANRKVEILGWTDRMPELLMSHHLLISKAGGATVQEATAAKTPMIVSQVVPGQEEGNARLLVENGCGRVSESHAEIAASVEEAFADDARLWRKWNTNIAKISRPAAALDIARFVLDTIAK